MKKSAALLTILVALAAGCGSDDREGVDAPNASETSASSAPATPNPVDQAIAEAALLTLADFPAGWEAKPADKDSDDDEESQRRIAGCLKVAYEDLYDGESGASADSKDFTNTNDDVISNSVGVVTDEARAKSKFAILRTDKFRECTLEELQKSMKDAADDGDFEIGEASLNEISFDSFGDESTAFRVTVPMEVEGFSVDVTLDLVFVRVGRAVTTVTSQSAITSIDAAELSEYVKIATDRLASSMTSG